MNYPMPRTDWRGGMRDIGRAASQFGHSAGRFIGEKAKLDEMNKRLGNLDNAKKELEPQLSALLGEIGSAPNVIKASLSRLNSYKDKDQLVRQFGEFGMAVDLFKKEKAEGDPVPQLGLSFEGYKKERNAVREGKRKAGIEERRTVATETQAKAAMTKAERSPQPRQWEVGETLDQKKERHQKEQVQMSKEATQIRELIAKAEEKFVPPRDGVKDKKELEHISDMETRKQEEVTKFKYALRLLREAKTKGEFMDMDTALERADRFALGYSGRDRGGFRHEDPSAGKTTPNRLQDLEKILHSGM